jgi:hypothetical protein
MIFMKVPSTLAADQTDQFDVYQNEVARHLDSRKSGMRKWISAFIATATWLPFPPAPTPHLF